MHLRDFYPIDFGRYKDFEIEDVGWFQSMTHRMIEDTDLMAYTVAQISRVEEIGEEIIRKTFDLISGESSIQFEQSHEEGVVNPAMVRDFARAPIRHTNEALVLLSKFLNFQIGNMLFDAAERTSNEGLNNIKLRFILPWCARWPWPYNKWC